MSWNIQDFGLKKTRLLGIMAELLTDADLVMIQEVQIDEDGLQVIDALADQLATSGDRWAYTISDPTNGKGRERYAYLWKQKSCQLKGQAWLEELLDEKIDREPFMARFECGRSELLVANFHAVPKKKEPWWEIKELHLLDQNYKSDHLLIGGDFNLTQEDRAFDELKRRGIIPTLKNIKTTIKMEPKEDENFANDYDNILVEKDHFQVVKSGRIDFTNRFSDLKEARKLSDHVPVYVVIK